MRTIAVYPGRFHPFHKGHASSFKQLAKTFGLENTFLAISQKQEQPKSPFSAKDRAKMAVILGIPMQNILFVRNTYGGDEYMQQLQAMGVDVNDTALVLGVSGKDMGSDPRFSFSPKKDGSPSYLQPADNGIEAPMTQHAYIMTTDVAPFNIAGMAMTDASQIRSAYAKGDEELQNKILTDLYGKGSKHVKPIFDQNLAIMESIYNKLVSLKQRITESKQGVMEGSKCPPATQDITLNLKNNVNFRYFFLKEGYKEVSRLVMNSKNVNIKTKEYIFLDEIEKHKTHIMEEINDDSMYYDKLLYHPQDSFIYFDSELLLKLYFI
jgi:cytidyltransferase-like protein